MKKLLFAASALISFSLISCTNSGGMTATAKQNLETAQAVAKMFETADWSKTGDYFTNDVVDHAGMNGDVVGLDNIKAQFADFGKMMGDMKIVTVKELADDEYVFQWMKQSWTMKEDAMGMKAGSKNSADAIEVSKFKDGKISEHWSFISYTDMMKMMPQQGAMNNMMDTTMMNKTK